MFGGIVLLGALVWGVLAVLARGGAGTIRFPPPRAQIERANVTLDDFAGSEACEECHEPEYEAWFGSTHGNAGGLPTADVVIARFDGEPIRFLDAVVTPSVNAAGEYVFTVVQDRGETLMLRAEGVIGGGHMVGGGTQGFVSRFDDGSIRFLPWDFHPEQDVWFCNADGMFVPITEEMSLSECLDWPPHRILGTDRRNDTCQECHGSQITIDFSAGRYDTQVLSYTINCEACHGPGRRHIERSKAGLPMETHGVAALEPYDKDRSLGVCFQCHALKSVIEPGYLQGGRLENHYSLRSWHFSDTPLFPDGRIRVFAYQQHHVFSDCYLNGSMTCVDCHDPHTQEYRDIWGRLIEDRFGDEQCTDCHPSKAERPEEHTFHDPGTEGSRCIDCHMPYLQHPALGYEVRFARSDHTIPIPRPGPDDRMGIVNACALSGCHPDSSVQTLERITDEWYGDLKPRKPVVEGLLEVTEGEDRVSAAARLLHPEDPHPIAQISALGYLASEFLRSDMSDIEPAIVEAIVGLAETDDLDIRSVALATLHFARGHDPEMREYLADHLRIAGEDDLALRGRWTAALQVLGDQYLERGESSSAIVVYQKALEVLPQHPGILLGLAWTYNSLGDQRRAVDYYERSLEADPHQPGVRTDLQVLRGNLGMAGRR